MTILTASKARAKFYRLMDETAVTHEPIAITGRRTNAVLLSQEDWQAMQETLRLEAISGMKASIRIKGVSLDFPRFSGHFKKGIIMIPREVSYDKERPKALQP